MFLSRSNIKHEFISSILVIIIFFFPPLINSQTSTNDSEVPLRKALEEARKSLGINFIYSDNLVNNLFVTQNSNQTITRDNLKDFLSRFDLSYKKFNKNEYIIIRKEKENAESTYQTVLTTEEVTDSDSLELMIKPILLSKQNPRYPIGAARKGIEGSVRIKFIVSKKGYVTNSEVLATSGYAVLDSAAKDYVYTLRYSPGEINGKPHSTMMSMLVRYILEDRKTNK